MINHEKVVKIIGLGLSSLISEKTLGFTLGYQGNDKITSIY